MACTEAGSRSSCTPLRCSAADEAIGAGSAIAASRRVLYARASARKRAESAALAASLGAAVLLA